MADAYKMLQQSTAAVDEETAETGDGDDEVTVRRRSGAGPAAAE
jgi:hypothetical protein